MKRYIVRIYIVGCVLCSSQLAGFFIINSSTSPKKIEVIASIPVGNGTAVTPQVVLKKELKPDAIIEAPFALKEVVLDVHWGEEKTIPTEKTTWKPIETRTSAAQTWRIIDTLRCGEKHVPCHAVIPPTWIYTEDHTGITVTTDEGKTIHATSKADLATKIPYRRLVDSFPQERVLVKNAQESYNNWKKIGMNHLKKEEVVIPRTWSIKEEGNDRIITTDKGQESRIPCTREQRIDPQTGQEKTYTIANEQILKKVVPYRRKDGVVTEIQPVQRLFVIEESAQKPMKTTQYNLFRRFAAGEAEPAPFVRGVPAVLGEDHVFEIFGSDYATDISFMYVPDSAEPGAKRHKTEISTQPQEKNTHKMLREKKESFRQSRLRRSKKTSTVNGAKAA